MRDDFGVLILTHGRADRVITLKSVLQAGNYSGKWYMMIDNEDDQAGEYIRRYGREHVVEFDKQAVADWTDTADSFGEHRAIVYARNQSFYTARELGLKYFLMLDDDYTGLYYRYPEGNKLAAKRVEDTDRLFEAMIRFLDDSGALTVAFCQAGDFVGGLQDKRYGQKIVRKAMNTFFCRSDRPFQFVGTMNEDVTTYTTLGSRGELLMSVTDCAIVQQQTQKSAGGMSEAYLDTGTFVKSFYSTMSMPSAVRVEMLNTRHKRIHHKINWERCVPKILNERYRKGEN
jgi:hypothetical protein